jgi:GT2 family glycosyltransferase
MSNVSAIIVNYNAGEVLSACIASILTQRVQNIIVVDNASNDDSLRLLEQKYQYESRLKIIRNASNFGFAKACNIGVLASSQQYILFLNPDCVLEPGALRRMIEVLEANPAAGMVGGLLIDPDGAEQGGGRRAVPTPWRSLVRAFGLYRFADRWPSLFFDFYLHNQPLPDAPVEVEAISGALMLIRREALKDVGPLDEGYFMHCEDLDWCMRFRQRGWKIMFVPDARVIHQKGVCSKNRPIFVEWHKHKGMMRFYSKFFRHKYPGVLLWIVGFGVWLRFGAMAIYHSIRHIKQWLTHDRS